MIVSGRLCCLVGETRFDGERLARHPVGCFAVQNPLPAILSPIHEQHAPVQLLWGESRSTTS